MLIGGLTFPVIIVLWAAIFGVLSDFWDFYILGNLIYAGGSSLMDAFFRLPSFLAKSPDF
ncbi:MAG: hypothetical protein R2822_29250 [Spirosomataceae bacterium]